MRQAFADRLIGLCERHADQIAEQWHQSLSSNSKTRGYNSVNKANCLRHATSFYKNLGQMYFADNCYEAVTHNLDVAGFAEDNFARGIPLDEVIYSLILMRRQIWLHSEQQSIYNAPEDMTELVGSINRILLLFDYAIYVVTRRYHEMSTRSSKAFVNKPAG